MGTRCWMPALFTRISSGPTFSSTQAMPRAASVSLVTSKAQLCTRPGGYSGGHGGFRGLEPLGVDAVEHHGGAGVGQGPGQGVADPPAGAGHQGYAPRQVK